MVTSRTVLKKVVTEGEPRLERAARQSKLVMSKLQTTGAFCVLRRQEIRQYAEEIFKAIDRVLENASYEEAIQRNKEVAAIHLQMEAVRIRLEQTTVRLAVLLKPSLQEPFRAGKTSCSVDHLELSPQMPQPVKALSPTSVENASGPTSP